MGNFDLRKYLAEGKLYEASIPSGWKKIDTSNDYEEEDKQGRLMGFEAPMNGIEGDEVDNIYIEQDGDEFEVHIMTAFNNPEYKGPFNSKEEALKVAIQKMEDLKKDWDEKDLGEGKLHELDSSKALDPLPKEWYSKYYTVDFYMDGPRFFSNETGEQVDYMDIVKHYEEETGENIVDLFN